MVILSSFATSDDISSFRKNFLIIHERFKVKYQKTQISGGSKAFTSILIRSRHHRRVNVLLNLFMMLVSPELGPDAPYKLSVAFAPHKMKAPKGDHIERR